MVCGWFVNRAWLKEGVKCIGGQWFRFFECLNLKTVVTVVAVIDATATATTSHNDNHTAH